MNQIQIQIITNKTIKTPGWLSELDKLTGTNFFINLKMNENKAWLCRLKKVNDQLVMPAEYRTFMTGETLQGSRLLLYVLLKIIKRLMDAPVKSFMMKIAVAEMCGTAAPDENNLGAVALQVMNHKLLKGK